MLSAEQTTSARTARDLLRFSRSDFERENCEYETEWEADYSADIGGRDGTFASCTITSCTVLDPDTGNDATFDRNELILIFGREAVEKAERAFEDEENGW